MDNRFTSERQLGQHTVHTSSQAYDKQLLSKIGGPNTPRRTNAPPQSSAHESIDSRPHLRMLNGLKPLSTPDRRNSNLDSPGVKWPPSRAMSPSHSGFRSPILDSTSVDSQRSPFGSISTHRPLDDIHIQHRGSYDHSIFPNHDFSMEEKQMRNLNINDRSLANSEDYQSGPNGGLKRRASSPPLDVSEIRVNNSEVPCSARKRFRSGTLSDFGLYEGHKKAKTGVVLLDEGSKSVRRASTRFAGESERDIVNVLLKQWTVLATY
jgi:hypothetical protein